MGVNYYLGLLRLNSPLVLGRGYVPFLVHFNLGHNSKSATLLESQATHIVNIELINPKKVCAVGRSNAGNTGQRLDQSTISVHGATYTYVPAEVLVTRH